MRAPEVDTANAWHDDDGFLVLSLRVDGAWHEYRMASALAGDIAAHLQLLSAPADNWGYINADPEIARCTVCGCGLTAAQARTHQCI